jgi:hypothetical protein
MDLLFREIIGERRKITSWEIDVVPIKIASASRASLHGLVEVCVDRLLHVLMLGDPTRSLLQAENEVLPSSSVDSHVEIFRVGVAFFQVSHEGTLFFPRPLHDRKARYPLLKPFSNVVLLR